jgi:methionyl aminopeptidase
VAIPIRSPRDIDGLRRAGALLWRILDELVAAAAPGVRTAELAELAWARITEAGAEPVFLSEGDPAFPGAAAITINEEVSHAPPGARRLRAGDLVTIDAGLRLDCWCADASRVVLAGGGAGDRARLAAASASLTDHLIERAAPGLAWADLAAEAANAAAARRVSIVRGFQGHGLGHELHEPPALDFHAPGPLILRPGMVLTIEPIVTTGSGETARLPDGRTHITADRAPACCTERTIAITRDGIRILTAP